MIIALFAKNSKPDSSGLQAAVPSNLLDCYKNHTLLTRENLPPFTLNVLLSIIRKLETISGDSTDMRTLSSQIMNRQDKFTNTNNNITLVYVFIILLSSL